MCSLHEYFATLTSLCPTIIHMVFSTHENKIWSLAAMTATLRKFTFYRLLYKVNIKIGCGCGEYKKISNVSAAAVKSTKTRARMRKKSTEMIPYDEQVLNWRVAQAYWRSLWMPERYIRSCCSQYRMDVAARSAVCVHHYTTSSGLCLVFSTFSSESAAHFLPSRSRAPVRLSACQCILHFTEPDVEPFHSAQQRTEAVSELAVWPTQPAGRANINTHSRTHTQEPSARPRTLTKTLGKTKVFYSAVSKLECCIFRLPISCI